MQVTRFVQMFFWFSLSQVAKLQRPSISSRDFRVVCDNMLQGLGRYLRACGVDVKILENSDDHDLAAKVKSFIISDRLLNNV